MRRMILAPVVLALVAAPVLGGSIIGNADCRRDCDTVVLYLEGGPSQDGAGTSVVFDQKDKVFVPHLLPVVQGTTVNIKNGDSFLHNVHVYQGKDTVLNIALPFQGQVMPHTFAEPGTYTILCDAHPEMSAYILVLENSYFAVPSGDGDFEIGDVPPGEYTLVRYDAEKDKSTKKPLTMHEEGDCTIEF
ncbi:MAG: plastocyanin/azurin family copper-binding protein [Thermoanaerobaculia bacterium]